MPLLLSLQIEAGLEHAVYKSLSSKAPPPRAESDCTPRQDRRIEVHITQGPDGKRQVLLQDLSHGAGVGWYVQKTIRLDREQVDALLASLCCARHGGSFPCPEAGKASSSDARILQIESLLKA